MVRITGCGMADCKYLSPQFVGREFDEQLLSDFPREIDPCGENGEFHSFVYAGPMFRHDLQVERGEIVRRDRFVFADLMPANSKAAVSLATGLRS